MKNIVYFDLETQKSADEVGGWNNIARMGMSIGVTFSTARGDYKIYGEKQVNDLLTDLQRADLVVGFNILRFDYEVLHGYTSFDLRQLPTLDMMVELQNKLQHRLSLDSIATATFGVEKTAEGLQAIRWFKDGKLAEIAEYCCYDVKLTKARPRIRPAPQTTALSQSFRQKNDCAGELVIWDFLRVARLHTACFGAAVFAPRFLWLFLCVANVRYWSCSIAQEPERPKDGEIPIMGGLSR